MLPDALFAAFHCRRRSRRAAEQVDKAFAAMAEIVSEFGNKPQSSELAIRRIIEQHWTNWAPGRQWLGPLLLWGFCEVRHIRLAASWATPPSSSSRTVNLEGLVLVDWVGGLLDHRSFHDASECTHAWPRGEDFSVRLRVLRGQPPDLAGIWQGLAVLVDAPHRRCHPQAQCNRPNRYKREKTGQ